MKKLLVTGFDPFGGQSINPAWEAVKRLPEQIGDNLIYKQQVPTIYSQAFRTALKAAEEVEPDIILCVGQAGGRAAITPEMVAVNLRYANGADNAGTVLKDVPVIPDGPAAYFSTLPVRAMTEAINAAGIRAAVSYSAGTFVCNDLLYMTLHHFAGTDVRAAFIHVPFLPEQAGDKHPSMPLDEIVKGLTAAIAVI